MSDWLPWAFLGYVVLTELRLGALRGENRALREELRALRAGGAAVALALLAPAGAEAFPLGPRAHAYAKEPTHPDNALVDALVFLETKVPPDEWCFWRFFHWLPIAAEDLPDDLGKFRAYVQMLNGTAPGPVRPVQVDRAGRVWAVDRREAGWSAAAFHAVARLDRTCTEPNVDHQLAEELRRAIGVPADKTTFHCEGLVPGYWFVREVEETDRHRDDPENIAYYNLLYSRERFGDDFPPIGFVDPAAPRRLPGQKAVRPAAPADPGPEPPRAGYTRWPGGVWRVEDGGDGRFWPEGSLKPPTRAEIDKANAAREAWRRAKARFDAAKESKAADAPAPAARVPFAKAHGNGFVDRDFPRDENDFRTRWGVQQVNDFLAGQRIFKSNGTIIAGFFNDPKAGSLVSDNDRVNRFQNGPLGLAMETNDFQITAGRRNIANDPLGVALNDLNEDASEKIYQKQDDWPVWWLNGPKAKGAKRVESGDPHVVHDKINGGTVIVQTLTKCVGCHYPSDVVLSPSNEKLHAALRRGQELLAYTKAQQLTIDRFFFDGDAAGPGWQRNLKRWREPFAGSLAAATRSAAEPAGWTGARFASVNNSRRDWYDAPVTLGQAAAELGYPRLAVMVACAALGDFDAQTLFLDGSPGVPRAAWDADLFPQLAAVLAYARDAEVGDPAFQYFFPDLVRDARAKIHELRNPKGGK